MTLYAQVDTSQGGPPPVTDDGHWRIQCDRPDNWYRVPQDKKSVVDNCQRRR